jgi:hypothetical protein
VTETTEVTPKSRVAGSACEPPGKPGKALRDARRDVLDLRIVVVEQAQRLLEALDGCGCRCARPQRDTLRELIAHESRATELWQSLIDEACA